MRRREKMELALSPPVPLDAGDRPEQDPAQARDAELLVRVAGGDFGAFDELYRRFVRSIFGLALRRLGDRSAAEDVVQETSAAIWRSARTYRPERGPASPWLYAIARNAVVDRLRERRDTLGDDVPEMPSLEAGPPERAESADAAWRIHRALESLPEREREVVELAYWSGLSQSEVAEYLHLPLGTVKTRTRSALMRLADVLEGELE